VCGHIYASGASIVPLPVICLLNFELFGHVVNLFVLIFQSIAYQWVSHLEQELITIKEQPFSPPGFNKVRIARSLVCYVQVARSLVCYVQVARSLVCYVQVARSLVCYVQVARSLVCCVQVARSLVCCVQVARSLVCCVMFYTLLFFWPFSIYDF
jgi:hypothetical protein